MLLVSQNLLVVVDVHSFITLMHFLCVNEVFYSFYRNPYYTHWKSYQYNTPKPEICLGNAIKPIIVTNTSFHSSL